MTKTPMTTEEREGGSVFAPKFDSAGLLTAVVVDHGSGDVLVVAHMNAEALEATLSSGTVHFWSRSRGQLWMKGESSGNILTVERIMVDCDQDSLLVLAHPAGPTCHNNTPSCFAPYSGIATGDLSFLIDLQDLLLTRNVIIDLPVVEVERTRDEGG